jgi:hypothetical protein
VDANVSGSRTTTGNDGGSGIGTGSISEEANAAIGHLRIAGLATLLCDSFGVSQVSISNASVLFFTQRDNLFGMTPELSPPVSLTILYGTAAGASHETSLADLPFLSIGNLNLPVQAGWRFVYQDPSVPTRYFEKFVVCLRWFLVKVAFLCLQKGP